MLEWICLGVVDLLGIISFFLLSLVVRKLVVGYLKDTNAGEWVALRFSGVNFVSLNFIDYVSMALCMGDNRVGDTSDLLDLPQEVGLGRRGSF